LFIFVISLFSISCKKTPCEAEKLGTIKLDPLPTSVLSLKGNEKLIFKDKNSVERIFLGQGKRISTIQVNAGRKCTVGSFENKNSIFYFYEEDTFYFNYVDAKTPDEVLHYSIITINDDTVSKDTTLVDVLHCDLLDAANAQNATFLEETSPNSIDNGVTLIASKRGFKGKLTNFDFDNTPFTLVSTIINGKTLNNVIKLNSLFTSQSFTLYVAAQKGIVAFTNGKGESWVLDRVE
jgi:hypothetical protein